MTIKPYPKYKASGVEWLGDVPEGWEAKALKHCVEIPITDGPHETPVFVDSGMQFISAEAIKSSRIDFGRRRGFITNELYFEYSKKCTPRRDDIFMVKSGNTTGTFAIVETDDAFAIWSPLALIRVDPRQFSPKFVYYNFAADFFQENVRISCSYGTQPNIGMGVIEGLVVSVPPLVDQQNIATFLDRETAKIDTLIAKQESMIGLLKEKRQAVISHAVTKGLDPSVPMKASGVEWLGDVPEHWNAAPFKSAVGFQEGPGIMADDFKENGIPLLRIANVGSYYTTLEGCNFLDPDKVAKKWSHFQVKFGDLLISASATMGTVTEVTREMEGSVPYTGIIRLFPKTEKSIRDFVRHFVVSSSFLRQIDLLKAGATIQHFGPTHLAQIKMALPPIAEQLQISEYLRLQLLKIDALITKAQQAISLQKEHRTALISAAVTGKIDVRGENELREAA